MKKRILSMFLCISMVITMLPLNRIPVMAVETWQINNNEGWTVVYAQNNQNDYLLDQQTASGQYVSQDIVGDATSPAVYIHLTETELAFRVRVNNKDGGTSDSNYEFKNFAFIGMDADLNGSIDLFLGVYNPTGNNGRIGIYGSNSSYLNMGPSSTGINGKPLIASQPVRGSNYSITKANSTFSSNEDFFVSFKFSVADINTALNSFNKKSFNKSTPFRFITGTASQDNSFNQDINGMDKNGWLSGASWDSLKLYSNIVSPDGTTGNMYRTVIFDKNTGDVDADPSLKVVSAGSALGTLPTQPTKRGMYFQEWNTNYDGSGTTITSSTVISNNITAYAIWSDKKSYSVTFNPNGGNFSGSTNSITFFTNNGVFGDHVHPIQQRAVIILWDGKML